MEGCRLMFVGRAKDGTVAELCTYNKGFAYLKITGEDERKCSMDGTL
jgi:hypothetical protein